MICQVSLFADLNFEGEKGATFCKSNLKAKSLKVNKGCPSLIKACPLILQVHLSNLVVLIVRSIQAKVKYFPLLSAGQSSRLSY